jgi:hypothetical protein
VNARLQTLLSGVSSQPPRADPSRYAGSRVGGILLYAERHEDLVDAVDGISTAIREALERHLTLNWQDLFNRCSKAAGRGLTKPVFQAVLSRCLQRGLVECLIAEQDKGKTYRFYILNERRVVFDEKLAIVEGALCGHGFIRPLTVQRICFSTRQTWARTSARHLLEHLVSLGRVVPVGVGCFAWPHEVESAVDPLE